MGKRRLLQSVQVERSPVPLVVSIVGLVAAVSSFWIANENLSEDVFGCGVISAGYCAFYWLINPKQRPD